MQAIYHSLYSQKPHAALPKTVEKIPGSSFPSEECCICIPCRISQHFQAAMQLGCSSPRLLDLAAHPRSLGEWQSPSKGARCFGFGTGTVLYLLRMTLSVRKGKTKSLKRGRNWWLLPWKCCVQKDYFIPAILHLVLPKTEVSYSQVMVTRKNVSIKIRILVLQNLIRFPQTHTLLF